MTLHELSLIRLYNQQVLEQDENNPHDLVSFMGAMQAQDYAMAKWAVGTRLPGATNKSVQAAIDSGAIIRTHVLRPTWHFVSATDAAWMLELTAPHIKRSLQARHRELELTPAALKKSIRIIEKVLSGGRHLTREEIVSKLEAGKTETHDQRIHHILLMCELDRIICSGAINGKKNTYGLFAERVVTSKKLTRDEALMKLAAKYFRSHGPATIADFIWWSGLPVADARKALEMVKHDLNSQKIDTQNYWFSGLPGAKRPEKDSIFFLPAFDEFIISYKDRSACLTVKNRSTTISSNGIFRPVIVLNGQVIGLWKRATLKNKIVIEPEFFSQQSIKRNKDLAKLAVEAADRVANFFSEST
jgi:hypothetical protein